MRTMHPGVARRRSGMALVLALVVLAVLGALVAGAFAAAIHEARAGADSLQRVRAFAAAEYGLYVTLAPSHWRTDWAAPASHGLLATRIDAPDAKTSDTVRVWRPSPSTIIVVATGIADGLVTARRRLALLVDLTYPRIPDWAAVIAREKVEVREQSVVRGTDAGAASDCPPEAANLDAAAVAVPDSAIVDTAGCGPDQCLVGSPPVATLTAAAADPTYDRFGEVTRARMAAAARLVPAGITIEPRPSLDVLGACDTSVIANLGDPDVMLSSSSPCGAYRPAVYAPGNLHLNGGAGQGTLIVDGDLTLDAGTRFYGIVLVRGTVRLADGAELHGAVLARRASLAGGSRVQRSTCAVWRAARSLAFPRAAPGPSWTEMPW